VSDGKSKVPISELVNATQHNFSSEQVAFVTDADGAFYFCVSNASSDKETVSIKISSGVAANDFSDLPTSKELHKSASVVENIKTKLAQITESLQTLRARDEELRKTNDTIYSRVWGYSFCSLGLLIGLGVFQLVYLKIFFKQKKIA
jgi:hypothetical protein